MKPWGTLCLLVPALRAVLAQDSFHESLTLRPLPDGKLSVLFEFTTYFSSGEHSQTPLKANSHHSLTPPALLLPLQQNNVSELTISFVAGQWDSERSGRAGPLHEAGGGGGEVRGWLRGDPSRTDDAWTSVTHALGGLFCAGLGPSDPGDVVQTFGHIYPPIRSSQGTSPTTPLRDLTHYFLPHPFLHLCTENLTPFLSLLPSKGRSGLSALLKPGVVFSWGFKTEGIEVIMPDDGPGRWKGWWEGVVDLHPTSTSPSFSLQRLFNSNIPKPFPEASESVLRLITDSRMSVDPPGSVDGNVVSWDLLNSKMSDVQVRWDDFSYPHTFDPPEISIFRTVTKPHASDGVFKITITNHGAEQDATYSEVWPWWVKGWISEMSGPVLGWEYHPSHPPFPSTTTLHLSLRLATNSTTTIRIPFTKLTLKYTEHRPDAERGVDLPSGVLTLGDKHIYTNRLLLDVPTPDFSMPYNVIIMSSTVMAIFFGLMHGALTRRWGWVEVKP